MEPIPEVVLIPAKVLAHGASSSLDSAAATTALLIKR